ncbi:hypothetical protein D3C72_947580 [compost metagenome]
MFQHGLVQCEQLRLIATGGGDQARRRGGTLGFRQAAQGLLPARLQRLLALIAPCERLAILVDHPDECGPVDEAEGRQAVQLRQLLLVERHGKPGRGLPVFGWLVGLVLEPGDHAEAARAADVGALRELRGDGEPFGD